MQNITNQVKLKKRFLRKNLPACLVGLFLLLAAGLAGMFAAKAFAAADTYKLLRVVCGISLKSFFWCAVSVVLGRVFCLIVFAASSCYPASLPFGLFMFVWLPFQMGFSYMCACLLLSGLARVPLFLSFLILFVGSLVNWMTVLFKTFGNVKRVFLERNVPRTGREVLLGCGAFLSKCIFCVAVQTGCAIAEAACLYLLLS